MLRFLISFSLLALAACTSTDRVTATKALQDLNRTLTAVAVIAVP